MKTKWITKDGRKIPIKEMSDSHLINTIKMLLRSAKKYQNEALLSFPSFQGEMAQYYAEQEYDALAESTEEDILENNCLQWKSLIKEADKRNLDWRIKNDNYSL